MVEVWRDVGIISAVVWAIAVIRFERWLRIVVAT